jgi:acetylornithine/succinyldiaminopimelate/putrescine aminotransferase
MRQMARHHAIMGHEMGNAVNRQKYGALIVERIGGAGVRVPPVQGLLALRECGRF